MMMLVANRRDESAIRNVEPSQKNYKYSKGKKIIEFFLSLLKIYIFYSLCSYFLIKFLKGYLVSGLKGVRPPIKTQLGHYHTQIRIFNAHN